MGGEKMVKGGEMKTWSSPQEAYAPNLFFSYQRYFVQGPRPPNLIEVNDWEEARKLQWNGTGSRRPGPPTQIPAQATLVT